MIGASVEKAQQVLLDRNLVYLLWSRYGLS